MKSYEYISAVFDFGDLGQLNRLASVGWRVVLVQHEPGESKYSLRALLEREVIEPTKAS